MNRRNPRTMTNPRRASRAYSRRMAPGAPGSNRIASRERLARRQRAERIARMRKRAQDREENGMEETTDEEEEREARVRSARRRRAQAPRRRAQATRTRSQATRTRSAGSPERRMRASKIDVLSARLDRIARILEKQAEADPLAKGTQNLNRELDDSLRPEELGIGAINEQPVTEDEALAEEVDGETTINTKPVSSRVRPIRMAHRSAGTDMDLF